MSISYLEKKIFAGEICMEICYSPFLEPIYKKLNKFEMEKIASLELDYNFCENPIRTSHRLSLAHVTYHSQFHKRISAKRCNYA